jgi:hypothetical protein
MTKEESTSTRVNTFGESYPDGSNTLSDNQRGVSMIAVSLYIKIMHLWIPLISQRLCIRR